VLARPIRRTWPREAFPNSDQVRFTLASSAPMAADTIDRRTIISDHYRTMRQADMNKRLLLVHNTRYHFEVMLAFWSDLHPHFDVSIWSNDLGVRNRQPFVDALSIRQHQDGDTYDGIILVTAEAKVPDEAIVNLIAATPTIRIVHRAGILDGPGAVPLFPHPGKHIVICSLDVLPALPVKNVAVPRAGFLIQGNIEPRRDYDDVNRLAAALPGSLFKVVGATVPQQNPLRVTELANIRRFANLDEADFHHTCRTARFILPMLDPERFPQYFRDRTTTSVLVGLGHGLPFVAHERLFELYPICGLPYASRDSFVTALSRAGSMPDAEYAALRAAQEERRHAQRVTNVAVIAGMLDCIRGTSWSKP
jgi:hypothetical protein